MAKTIGALLALVLLIGYVWMFTVAASAARCKASDGALLVCVDCRKDAADRFGADFVWLFNAVAGLVSAVVVAELAATTPGDGLGVGQARWVRVGKHFYGGAWLLLGCAAMYWGLFGPCEDAVPLLTGYAKTWFGIALGGVYAYFGVKPGTPVAGS